jgi:outer membrane cobalamin receptor
MIMTHTTRMRGRATAAALAIAVLAAGAGTLAAQEITHSATVRDAVTGAPLAGVRVSAGRHARITGSDGAFSLPGHADTVTIRFRRAGYADAAIRAGELPAHVPLRIQPVLLDALTAVAPRVNDLAAGTALAAGHLGADDLRAGTHTSLGEALAAAEGVGTARMGAWGARPVLRGLTGERVAVLVDGKRVQRACTGGMDQGLATVDPATVERVEILAGPGSTLHGSGNVGGVINVITRTLPADAPLTAELRAGASAGVPGATLGGTLRGVAGAGDLQLALDAARYGDYRTPDAIVANSGFRTLSGDLLAGHRLGDAGRLALRGQLYEGRDIGWPAMRGGAIPRESRRALSLDYGAQLGRGALDGVAARAYVQRLDHHMLMEMPAGMAHGHGGMAMDDPPQRFSVTDQRSHSTVTGARAQLRLAPLVGSHLDAGIEATHWAAEATRWSGIRDGDGHDLQGLALRTWPAARILDVGVFAQGAVPVTARFTGTGGLRLDRADRAAEGHAAVGEWIATGNVGLRAALAGGLAGRAVLGFGYRLPDPTELFGLLLRPDGFAYLGNPGLATERGRNLEAGLTWDGAATSAGATLFRNDLSGAIAPVLVPADSFMGRPVRSYANIATARLSGATGSLNVTPRERVLLRLTGALTRGTDVDTGRPLVAVPPAEASAALRVIPAGSLWLEAAGRVAATQDRAAAHAGEAATPGWSVLDLRGGFTRAATRFTVSLDNVLDRAYRGHLDPVALLRPGRSLSIRATTTLGG